MTNLGWKLIPLAALCGMSCTVQTNPGKTPTPPQSSGVVGEHGLILAEAIQVYSRQEVLAGKGEIRGWVERLHRAGIQDAALRDGTEVLLRTGFMRNNARGKLRENTLLAHLGPGVQVEVAFGDGMRIGALVEVERSHSGFFSKELGVPIVVRVRERRAWNPDEPSNSLTPTWRSHRYQLSSTKGFEKWMNLLNPMGGAEFYFITGNHLEEEGWILRPPGVWWKPMTTGSAEALSVPH